MGDLERQVRQHEESAEELIAGLSRRDEELRAYQTHIAELEAAAAVRQQADTRLKWLLLHTLFPLLLLAGLATFASLFILSRSSLEVRHVVPVAAVAAVFMSFVWAERIGSSMPAIATWPPHQWIARARNWIGAAVVVLALTLLGEAIYDDIS
jgi:hypothetical protein